MSSLALGGTLAFLVMPATAQDERTLVAEIARLIERTNALESFHAVYIVETSRKQGSVGHWGFELSHRAPDVARIRLAVESAVLDVWLVDDRMYWFSCETEEWHTAPSPEPGPSATALDELFPPASALLPPGLSFVLSARGAKDASDVEVWAGHHAGDRRALLSWLPELLDHADELGREGDAAAGGVRSSSRPSSTPARSAPASCGTASTPSAARTRARS